MASDGKTGNPKGDGTGGSGQNLKAEFNKVRHVPRHMLYGAGGQPSRADSQFFIMLGNSPHLDNQYTAWGKVTSGMEFVDKIKKGNSSRNGSVDTPDVIVKLQVAADEKKK